MEKKNCWVFDNFYSGADAMRQKIDDHFDEDTARPLPFEQRAIWNYWHVPHLYTYLRARPGPVFKGMHRTFMTHLRVFAAQQFGLQASGNPFLSMYINGCGQNIHNDARNGRLAYVYSLTRWNERGFTGGETFVYKTGEEIYSHHFAAMSGMAFYDSIEPLFNRLAVFDDRMPHAVNTIQGTMNPQDARFVMHGHFVEPDTVPFVEGGLLDEELASSYVRLRDSVAEIFRSYHYHGFVTWRVDVEPSGIVGKTHIKHMQLIPEFKKAEVLQSCLDDAIEQVAQFNWPASETASKLIFAISSDSLRE